MLQYVKKILMVAILLCTWYFVFSTNSVFATSDGSEPFYEQSQNYENDDDNLNIAGNLTSNELESDESTFARIRDFFGMGTYAATGKTTPALVYIQTIVNILLGLVSLLSLIMVIIAFYLIFFSKQEEAVGKAKKLLIWVAIALAVMWLSRYIVSYFYNIYSTTTWAF